MSSPHEATPLLTLPRTGGLPILVDATTRPVTEVILPGLGEIPEIRAEGDEAGTLPDTLPTGQGEAAEVVIVAALLREPTSVVGASRPIVAYVMAPCRDRGVAVVITVPLASGEGE